MLKKPAYLGQNGIFAGGGHLSEEEDAPRHGHVLHRAAVRLGRALLGLVNADGENAAQFYDGVAKGVNGGSEQLVPTLPFNLKTRIAKVLQEIE